MKETMGDYVLKALAKEYHLQEKDLGADAKMGKSGMNFRVRKFDVKGIGNLCLLTMKGMMGLMKMETVVLACQEKDVPLINLDRIEVMGKKTQMVEFYDTMLGERDAEMEAECQKIKDQDADLENYISGGHWYDNLVYPCTYAKKVKAKEQRTEISCRKYFDIYLEALKRAGACDPAAKKEKNQAFAQGLLDHGGPAVDQVKKLFGEEKAQKLILDYMYGVME